MNIKPPYLRHIGIAKRRETAETEQIPCLFHSADISDRFHILSAIIISQADNCTVFRNPEFIQLQQLIFLKKNDRRPENLELGLMSDTPMLIASATR